MSELEERINSVLNDPQQLSEITKLARSLMGGGDTDMDDAMPPNTGMQSPLPGMFGQLGLDTDTISRISRVLGAQDNSGNANSHALLEAMKPYLSDKRKKKMDKAMKLARLARLAGLAMGEMEGKDND